jgi:hypothetical protein
LKSVTPPALNVPWIVANFPVPPVSVVTVLGLERSDPNLVTRHVTDVDHMLLRVLGALQRNDDIIGRRASLQVFASIDCSRASARDGERLDDRREAAASWPRRRRRRLHCMHFARHSVASPATRGPD